MVGKVNIAKLDVLGPRGHARRWTIQFTKITSGVLDSGIFGGFAGGRQDVFYGPDTYNGRPIVVRFVIDVWIVDRRM